MSATTLVLHPLSANGYSKSQGDEVYCVDTPNNTDYDFPFDGHNFPFDGHRSIRSHLKTIMKSDFLKWTPSLEDPKWERTGTKKRDE